MIQRDEKQGFLSLSKTSGLLSRSSLSSSGRAEGDEIAGGFASPEAGVVVEGEAVGSGAQGLEQRGEESRPAFLRRSVLAGTAVFVRL